MTVSIDEYLDIVDENDKVIGRKKRSEVYKEGLSNFRVVNLFILNSNRELWIPRRAADKRLCPLCLDASMGGHVISGETYEEALSRELKEELNIDLENVRCTGIGYLTPHENAVSAFMKVYEIRTDLAPDYNRADFVEYFWLTRAALFERIERGERTKGDLPKLVEFFYS
ncbi:MAG: NUDIX domain-containing protein [Nitrospirae bacterium]|nr:NUDIX domain-containing protein [Nitrospirota bacterium]